METALHYPGTPAGMSALQDRVSRIHAQYVIQYVNSLHCPLEQKRALLTSVADRLHQPDGAVRKDL